MLLSSDRWPEQVYTGTQARELDRLAIEEAGVEGFALMTQAGRAAFQALTDRWPDVSELLIFCGTGNNGGDGFIVAALAKEAGFSVRLGVLGQVEKVRGDAAKALQQARGAGVELESAQALAAECTAKLKGKPGGRLIVDALFGIGLNRELRDSALQLIQTINGCSLPVMAIDVPSGLDADTGAMLPDAVRAELTVTFIAMKTGLLTAQGVDCVGQLLLSPLSVPNEVFARLEPLCYRMSLARLLSQLPARSPSAHKGIAGHVLVVGGDTGMGGAALLAASAAARCGAGLISCATRPEHAAAMISRQPEIMSRGVAHGDDLEPLLERCSVIAIGPGLGRDAWGRELFNRVLRHCGERPLVIDADGLVLLKQWLNEHGARSLKGPVVLTPHPGEAAMLLDCRNAEIQADRFDAGQRLLRAVTSDGQVAVVLKGAGSLVFAEGEPIGLSCYGNPGMASGGMGDVLTGVVAALLAQGLAAGVATRLAVCLHGAAADLAARDGERGLLASDLLPALRSLINGGEEGGCGDR